MQQRMRRRVAMLVLNDCRTDGRVHREATALVEAGHEVRVFAVASAAAPAGMTGGVFSVERLPAASAGRRAAAAAGLTGRGPRPDAPAAAAGARVARRVLLRVHRPLTFLRFWLLSTRAVSSWRPDAVHAHDLNTLPGAARVARTHRIPLVYDSHELWRRRNRQGQLRPIGRLADAALERRYIARADAVVTVSEGIADWLSDRYRLPRRPTVIRNLPARPPRTDAPSLRAQTGAGPSRVLLYSGRIMPHRGLEQAIAVLPHLPADLLLVLLGYGDEDYLRRLRTAAASAGVGGRVRVVPAVAPEQVAAVAAEADAALVAVQPVCLSHVLCLPNKLFDAVQAGLPVVATDLPEVAATVARHSLGELFRAGDPRSMVDAIERVLADPRPYRRAARRAAITLCWEREKALLLEVYRDLPWARCERRPHSATPVRPVVARPAPARPRASNA